MHTSSILSHAPSKSFNEILNEKLGILKRRGISDQDVSSKTLEFNRFIKFEELVTQLKELVSSLGGDIDESRAHRIIQYLSKLQIYTDWLEEIDTGSNNIGSAFKRFDDNIQSTFLQYNVAIPIRGNGSAVQVPESLINIYIEEVQQLIDNIKSDLITNEQLLELKTIYDELISKKELFRDASGSAEQRITRQQELLELVINKQRINFIKKSELHEGLKIKPTNIPLISPLLRLLGRKGEVLLMHLGIAVWLRGALAFGAVVMGIVVRFIIALEGQPNLLLGPAILRVSSIIVPGYFALFCANQYSYHRRLNEIYTFKHIALEVMNDLTRNIYTQPDERQKIIDKGVNVIFNEPTFKEEVGYDKNLMNTLLEVVKSKT